VEVRFHTFLILAAGRGEYSVLCSGRFSCRRDVYPMENRLGVLKIPPRRGSKERNIFRAGIYRRFFSRLHVAYVEMETHHTSSNKVPQGLKFNVAVCCSVLYFREVPCMNIDREIDFPYCCIERIFSRVPKAVTKSDCWSRNVCPHGTARLPTDVCSWRFIFGVFVKVCGHMPIWVKIRQK
jgi:hypothetical protein